MLQEEDAEALAAPSPVFTPPERTSDASLTAELLPVAPASTTPEAVEKLAADIESSALGEGRPLTASQASPAASTATPPPPPIFTAGGDSSASTASAASESVQNAVPVDKLKNGIAAATSFMSWGWNRTTAKASEVSAKVSETTSKLSDDLAKTDWNTKSQEIAARTSEVLSQGASEAARLSEQGLTKAKSGIETISQELQPALSQTAAAAGAAKERTAEKLAEVSEKMQPQLAEAGETAKTGLFGFASSAAKTAIWFQSLGAHRDDSEDEDEAQSADTALKGPGQPEGGAVAPTQSGMTEAATSPPPVATAFAAGASSSTVVLSAAPDIPNAPSAAASATAMSTTSFGDATTEKALPTLAVTPAATPAAPHASAPVPPTATMSSGAIE